MIWVCNYCGGKHASTGEYRACAIRHQPKKTHPTAVAKCTRCGGPKAFGFEVCHKCLKSLV